jgi:hypothetical protein
MGELRNCPQLGPFALGATVGDFAFTARHLSIAIGFVAGTFLRSQVALTEGAHVELAIISVNKVVSNYGEWRRTETGSNKIGNSGKKNQGEMGRSH